MKSPNRASTDTVILTATTTSTSTAMTPATTPATATATTTTTLSSMRREDTKAEYDALLSSDETCCSSSVSSQPSKAESTTLPDASTAKSVANTGAAPVVAEGDEPISTAGLWLYYFFHGIQDDMPGTALYLVLKETYGLEPAAFSFVASLNWIPWILKPLFGYISDRYPIGGRRRIPYLTAGIVLNSIGWWLLSFSTALLPTRNAYLAVMFATALAGVMAETAVDGLLAELARLETSSQVGLVQSTIWTYNAAGSVLGAFLPIVIFWYGYGPDTILHGTAAVAVLSTMSLLWIREKPFLHNYHPHHDPKTPTYYTATSTTDKDDATAEVPPTKAAAVAAVSTTAADLRECFQNPLLIKSLLFVFIVSSSPTSGTAFTYFQTDVLNFTPAFLSWTTVLQTAANFVAAAAYARWLRHWNLRTVFATAVTGAMLTGLINILVVQRWNLTLGIPDQLFIVGDTVAQGVAGEIVFMPVAVLAAHLAPAGREGTVYAVAMSVLNASWALSEFVSGLLSRCFRISSPDHYEHLAALILVVSALTLVPLIFLHFVPELSQLTVDDMEEEEDDEAEDEYYDDEDEDDVPVKVVKEEIGKGNKDCPAPACQEEDADYSPDALLKECANMDPSTSTETTLTDTLSLN